MRNLFTFIFCLISAFNYCQNISDSCDLQTANIEWKNKFQTLNSKSQQLVSIRKKIYNDSVYKDYKPKIKTHQIVYKALDKAGNDCGCKILFLLNYSKKNPSA